MSTKIHVFSCKYGEHLCMNKNKERDFKSQISYFLIPAPTQSPTFSDQRCKQIKTKVDTSWNWELDVKHRKLSMQGFFCVHSKYVGAPMFLKSTEAVPKCHSL